MSRLIAVLAIALATALLGAPSASARQVALVIGNEAYQHIARLRKSNADADAYAGVLRGKGYDVVLRHDLTRDEMGDAIASFAESLSSGDTAVFVYSGHGWSDGSQNYLLGVDIPSGGSQEFLARRSVPLKNGADGVIDAMDAKNAGLKIAIIDACRDNPFPPVFAKRGFGLSKGLAPVRPPSGTFVVFSAGAGQSALDALSETDPDPNGVFTRVFLPLLAENASLLTAIKTAQRQVSDLARSVRQDQWPAYYDEVLGEACLSKDCGLGTPTTPSLSVNRQSSPAPDSAASARVALGRLVPQLGHTNYISSISFSADSTLALTAGYDGAVKLWDLGEGRLLQTFSALDQQVQAAAITPDKSKVLAAGNNNVLFLWDARTGALIRKIATRDNATAIAILPGGREAVVAGFQSVTIFDLASGRATRTLDSEGAKAIAVARDGRTFVTADTYNVKVWDAASGEKSKSWELNDATGGGELKGISLSPDGANLLVLTATGSQTLWDVASGKLLKTVTAAKGKDGGFMVGADSGDPGVGRALDFLPASGQLLSVGPDYAQILKADTAETIATLAFAQGGKHITAAALAPDGTRFVTADGGTLELWDVAGKHLVRTLATTGAKGGTSAFARDGSQIAIAAKDGGLTLWTPATGETRRFKLADGIDATVLAFSPDNQTLLVAGADSASPSENAADRSGAMLLLDAASGAIVRRFDGHKKGIVSASFSADGARLASADIGEEAMVWDVASGRQLHAFKGHAIAFLPNKREVILAKEQVSQIADIASGKIRKTINLLAVGYEALPDSALMMHVTIGGKWPGFYPVYNLFDPEAGRVVRELGPNYTDAPLALSKSAMIIATGFVEFHVPLDPKKITLRDLQSGRTIRPVGLKGPAHTWSAQMEVGPGQLSPDGRQWLSFVGESWLLRDTDSGEVNQRLVLLPEGQAVDFFSDGTYVASDGADEFLAIVEDFKARSVDGDFRATFARKLAQQ